MITYNVPCPIYKIKLKDHHTVKKKTLDLIESLQCGSCVGTDDYGYTKTIISKCDWEFPKDQPRGYLDYILPYIKEEHEAMFLEKGFSKVDIVNIWFQQYQKNSFHEWHTHTQCQWSSVYYLEFPEGSPRTVFVNPLNNSETFDIETEEGDIITFPSFIVHSAPKIESENRKTILSFNSDISIL